MSESYDMIHASVSDTRSVLIEQLETLGLSPRQSKVYLALLRNGPMGAIEIARTTLLKHPTVYDVLDTLRERGLISESAGPRRKTFAAEPPVRLRETERLRASALNAVLPELESFYRTAGRRPGVRYFTGDIAGTAISEELLNCQDREYFYFGQVSVMMRRAGEANERAYLRKRTERGIWSYSIRIREQIPEPDFMRPGTCNLRRVRYLDRNPGDDIVELYLYDGKVAVVSSLRENYAMFVESRELFVLLKTLWRITWENLPPEEEDHSLS